MRLANEEKLKREFKTIMYWATGLNQAICRARNRYSPEKTEEQEIRTALQVSWTYWSFRESMIGLYATRIGRLLCERILP